MGVGKLTRDVLFVQISSSSTEFAIQQCRLGKLIRLARHPLKLSMAWSWARECV